MQCFKCFLICGLRQRDLLQYSSDLMPERIRRMFFESLTMKLSRYLASVPLDPASIWRVDSVLVNDSVEVIC